MFPDLNIPMKIIITISFLLLTTLIFAQGDSMHYIQVHFLYGSKPLRQTKATESKHFGGLHGGHVTIQVDDTDYGFRHSIRHTHIFPHKNRHSEFVTRIMNGKSRYGPDRKTVTFTIPITTAQYTLLNKIHQGYCDSTPYDYAFFGMRCASATQEILGKIGMLKKRNRFINVVTTFYPKPLRRRMLRLARKNNYPMITTEGRPTRRWERD